MSEPRKPIRILLVDDHPVVRQGLRAILSSFEEVRVAGEAAGGREAIRVCRELKPDVVVMDITMPDINGIETTTLLLRDWPDCKVLALSMHENRAYIQQALRAGARGYILKDCPPRELVRAIACAHEGRTELTGRAAEILVGDALGKRRTPELSVREGEVLRYLARGLSNKEISVKLNVGVRTVESHRESIIRKTGRATVAELTRYALHHGFADLDPAP